MTQNMGKAWFVIKVFILDYMGVVCGIMLAIAFSHFAYMSETGVFVFVE